MLGRRDDGLAGTREENPKPARPAMAADPPIIFMASRRDIFRSAYLKALSCVVFLVINISLV
jgi:hypothetical protein